MTTGKPSPASAPRPPDSRPKPSRGCASPHPASDRLRSAGWLVVAAASILAACFLTVALDEVRGSAARTDAAALFYRAIGLNELALTPSGRQGRRPDFLSVRIDGRFLPVLPRENPDVLPLLEAEKLTPPGATAP